MFIEFLLKLSNCDTVYYLCWKRIPNMHDYIEEKVLRFQNLEAIVTSGACEIGNYIVVYVGFIKTVESF